MELRQGVGVGAGGRGGQARLTDPAAEAEGAGSDPGNHRSEPTAPPRD